MQHCTALRQGVTLANSAIGTPSHTCACIAGIAVSASEASTCNPRTPTAAIAPPCKMAAQTTNNARRPFWCQLAALPRLATGLAEPWVAFEYLLDSEWHWQPVDIRPHTMLLQEAPVMVPYHHQAGRVNTPVRRRPHVDLTMIALPWHYPVMRACGVKVERSGLLLMVQSLKSPAAGQCSRHCWR